MSDRLHLERWGAGGPVVLMIHGLGASRRYWSRVAGQLAGDCELFAPDLLGFGRSPWPAIDYRVEDHLDALDGLLARPEFEDQTPILVGHSLGAILALALAARRPDRFRGLVLVGLPCYRSPEEARRHVAGLGPLAYATVATPRVGAAICALMCFGRPFWRLVAPLLLPKVPSEIARDGVLHTWRSYSGTLRHGVLDLRIAEQADRVAPTGLAVRLLHGPIDREAPVETITALAERMGWALELLPGVGHAVPIERPERCAQTIRALAKPGLEERDTRQAGPLAAYHAHPAHHPLHR